MREQIASYLYRADGGAISGDFSRAKRFAEGNPYSATADCVRFAYEQADHILGLIEATQTKGDRSEPV